MKKKGKNYSRVIEQMTVFELLSMPVCFLLFLGTLHEVVEFGLYKTSALLPVMFRMHDYVSSINGGINFKELFELIMEAVGVIIPYVVKISLSMVLTHIYYVWRNQSKSGTWRFCQLIVLSAILAFLAFILKIDFRYIRAYRQLLFAQALLHICTEFWNVKEKHSQGISYTRVFLAVGLFIIAIWYSISAVYWLYLNTATLRVIWCMIWELAVVDYHWNLTWLNLGSTFFTGCLVVISWSKDKPCNDWNPFSAKELNISARLPFVSLAMWVCICFASVIQANRLAYSCCILLLCSNITTAFSCYHLQDNRAVRKRIIYRFEWLSIPDEIGKSGLIIVDKDGSNETINSYSLNRITEFVENIQKISTHIINKMTKNSNKQQVRYMAGLIDEFKEICDIDDEKVLSNVGFLMGLGSLPSEFDDEQDLVSGTYYFRKLFLQYRSSGYREEDYYIYYSIGLLVGFRAICMKYSDKDSKQYKRAKATEKDMLNELRDKQKLIRSIYDALGRSLTDNSIEGLTNSIEDALANNEAVKGNQNASVKEQNQDGSAKNNEAVSGEEQNQDGSAKNNEAVSGEEQNQDGLAKNNEAVSGEEQDQDESAKNNEAVSGEEQNQDGSAKNNEAVSGEEQDQDESAKNNEAVSGEEQNQDGSAKNNEAVSGEEQDQDESAENNVVVSEKEQGRDKTKESEECRLSRENQSLTFILSQIYM